MTDSGLTHIALMVSQIDRTIAFYEKYANLRVVHRRMQTKLENKHVVWMSDGKRPFVVVFLEADSGIQALRPYSHLGYACASDEEFIQKCELARGEAVLIDGPADSGPPVGRWAFLADPDGHTLELSYGQDVEQTVRDHEMDGT